MKIAGLHFNKLLPLAVSLLTALQITPSGRQALGAPAQSGQADSSATQLTLTGAKPLVSDREAKELSEQLDLASDISIEITQAEGCPVTIVNATARGVKRRHDPAESE